MKINVVGAPRYERKNRSPKFPFQVRMRPWALTPFHISPVLPGETLENLQMQATVISDPLKSKLGGWWHESYFFYVKHRDLPQRDELVNMHLTGSALTTNRVTAQTYATYTFDNGIDWVTPCLQRITEEYFRSEGEAWNTNLIGNYPAVSVNRDWWGDSLIDDSVAAETVDAGSILQDPEDLTVSSLYAAQYARMRQMRATDMTFDDWLKMHGVMNASVAVNEDLYKPELVKYERQWTGVNNTVEPTTGVPSSAAYWKIQCRADKNRFFKEPGFLIGVMVCRPKVFFNKQLGAAVGALDEARLWMPSMMRDEAYTSIKKFENTDIPGQGPLALTPTNDYWADMRDLFIYGDQFLNFDPTDTADVHCPNVPLPTSALIDRYADATAADALFVGSTAATRLIRCDGIVETLIKGTVGSDQT